MMTNHITFAQFCSAVRRRGALGLCLVMCTLALGLSTSAQKPRIITFDAPFADLTPGDFNGTYPTSINDSGAITGYSNDANLVSHSFLRSPDGKFTTFQAPGADTNPADAEGTNATGINALGVITGYYGDSNGVAHGFLRGPDGKFTTFEVPGSGGFGSFPIAINLEGAVVGYYSDANYNFHAFLRSLKGTFTTWSGPGACENGQPNGCYGSSANNINVFGIAVGGFEDNSGNFVEHGLIRRPDGTLTTFDVPGAGTGSYQGSGCPGCARGLNLWGAVAGTYIDANSVQHGFLRSPDGSFTTFDAPGAGTGSNQGTGCPSDCATSLNDWGAITGVYIDANFVFHGYLRSPEGRIVTVDPVGTIFTVSDCLNDLGVVTGYYIDANGVYHGFLRIPD